MGAAASLSASAQEKLGNDIKATYDSKVANGEVNDELMLAEIKLLLSGAIALQQQHDVVIVDKENGGSGSGGNIDNQGSVVGEMKDMGLREELKSRPQFTLSKALSSHLELMDDAINFKIGDVIRACPTGEQMKFEGLVVAVEDISLWVDFGDDEKPNIILKTDCQRILNGITLEKDDVVQCKAPGTAVFCLGKIHNVHLDGTYDVSYDGVEEIDKNIAMENIRKIGSGRASLVKKFKSAASAITAARAFSKQGWWKSGKAVSAFSAGAKSSPKAAEEASNIERMVDITTTALADEERRAEGKEETKGESKGE